MKNVDYSAYLPRAYLPDKARFFNRFADEYNIVTQLAAAWTGGDPHVSEEERFFHAFCDLHPGDAGRRIHLAGSTELVTTFAKNLREVEREIEAMVRGPLSEHASVIDVIDDVAAEDNPFRLIRWALADRQEMLRMEQQPVKDHYPIAERWADRARLEGVEAYRKMAVAGQFTCLDAVDPEIDVAGDTSLVNQWCRERLYTGAVPIDVAVNHVVWSLEKRPKGLEGTSLLSEEFPITFGTPAYGTLPDGCTVETELMCCRVVEDPKHDRSFVVRTKSRPKTKLSAINKLEEGRFLFDRRGLQHCLVAVREGSVWRAATEEDVLAYRNLVAERLWRGQLVIVPDESAPNPNSNLKYQRGLCKIMGRLVRLSRRRNRVFASDEEEAIWAAPSVEHQMLSGLTLLRAKHDSNDGSPVAYARRKLISGVVPHWFSQHRISLSTPRALFGTGGAMPDGEG